MIVPEPPATLEGHCSVIYNNTLYTYSSNGFASIPLERNGTWSELSMSDEPVSNAACVRGGIDGSEKQQALYVIGGTSSRSKSNPPGLQRYTFNNETWETISTETENLSNRTAHSAIYLKSSSTIFIYGGSQIDDPEGSGDTFHVNTAEVSHVLSGNGLDPSYSPVLFKNNDEEAVLFGGNAHPQAIYYWTLDGGWTEASFNMSTPVPKGTKSALLSQANGEKMLETFDLSVSPNTIDYKVIMTRSGQSSEKRKRDYPSYDDTLAPTMTRQDYSLAQDDDGLIVLSGGSGTESLSIFNGTSNSWVNSTKLFYGDMSEQEILGSTTTTTSSSIPTATETESTTPASSSGSSDKDNIGTIIGATLGALVGVALILILTLFFIKRKKDKMRKAGGIDKDRLSFQDQGVEPLARSAYPMAESPAPRAASVDSLAIFSGNMGDEKSPRSTGTTPHYTQQNSQPVRPSPLNNIQSSGDSIYSMDDKAIEAQDSFVRSGDRTTDEGWGKYFHNNSTPTLIGMQPQFDSVRGSNATLWPGAGPAAGARGNSSLPPLNMSFLEQPKPLGQVNSGSPTTEFGRQIAIPESQSARISSASSASNDSDDDDSDRYHGARSQSWLGRPPSSAYSRSFYNPHQSTRELPSTATPTLNTTDYRRHDSARTNTRGSSILIPDGQPVPLPRNNLNSDMSWLNLHADR
ncbi:hypothetical protein BJX99DRAFT_221010 [Aspergillus californicus]